MADPFETMGLKSELLRGIYTSGLEKPSTFQQRALMPLLEGKDLVAQAQSGISTGKTTALSIFLLQKIDPAIGACQAIIIAPTRNRAQQIHKVLVTIGKLMDVECYACVGGHRHSDDIKALQDKQQLVVGTPGRMYDMIQRGALSTDSIQTYVLDEADETFSRGFNEQIYDIFKLLPQAQVVVTSGTMPQDVLDMTKLMRDPVQIKAEGDQLSLRGFKQFYISVAGEDVKIDILPDLLTVMKTQAVIFCNTRTRVEWLTEQFTARGVTVSTMHGDMRADHRHDIITVFHTNCSRVRILIATDMLARGLDVQQIPLVVNYDFPVKRETYIHRAVRKGFTINFITAGTDDVRMMGEVEQFYSTIIEKLPENFADIR